MTVVTEEGRRQPLEDFEVDIDVAVGSWLELGEIVPPRLLEVVFDLGMKTRRSEAVAPFLSPLPIIITEEAFVVVVVEGVIIAVVVDDVIVVGVDGGVVDAADERRRKRFIFMLRIYH